MIIVLTKFKKLALAALIVVFTLSGAILAYAGDYEIYDDAGIFSYDSDYQRLEEVCEELSEKVNVVVNSINGITDTESECNNLGREIFGSEPTVVFIINMTPGHREIWLRGINGAQSTITAGIARSITDNTYTSAKREAYAECAYKSMEQCLAIYEGNKIAQPMKFIVNIFISLMVGLLTVYCMIVFSRRKATASTREVMSGINSTVKVRSHGAVCIGTHRHRRSSDSSSGGGGGGHSGGGGGGGGHSF